MAGIEWLTHDHFAARIGEHFEMAVADGPPLALELVEAKLHDAAGGRGPQGQERQQFSLIFRGPDTPVMPQAIYLLGHPDFDDLELFLVPIGQDADGTKYQAAFA